MLSDLLLDVRFHIASFDEDVWYLFYKHFDDFKLLTPLFRQFFTKKKKVYDRIEYRLLGRLHRDNQPAVYYHNGRQDWYQYGKRHRANNPAIIFAHGSQYWYQHGQLHRDDGPAVIYDNGTQFWYQHGILIK